MTYEHKGYKLHKMDVELRGGRVQTIYFFSKKKPKSGEPCDLPPNKEVGENSKTGLPFLKNK
jgi:hypothetical protein